MMIISGKTLKLIGAAACAFVAVAVYSVDAVAEIFTLSEKETNSHMEVAVGDTVAIKLVSNPTTGYEWKFRIVPLDGAVRVVKNEFVPSDEGWTFMGAGGTHELILKAVKKGDAVVTGRYWREWEDFDPEEDLQVQYNIYVR